MYDKTPRAGEGSMTPYYTSKTPTHGPATPMYGSQTPMHDGGVFMELILEILTFFVQEEKAMNT